PSGSRKKNTPISSGSRDSVRSLVDGDLARLLNNLVPSCTSHERVGGNAAMRSATILDIDHDVIIVRPAVDDRVSCIRKHRSPARSMAKLLDTASLRRPTWHITDHVGQDHTAIVLADGGILAESESGRASLDDASHY